MKCKLSDKNKMCIQEAGNESIPLAKLPYINPLTLLQRRKEAYCIRRNAAAFQRNLPMSAHFTNNDEKIYLNKIASYSKALPHNNLGEVDLNAYRAWIKALTTGTPRRFEAIPLGGTAKLSNPQASYAYNLVGGDSHYFNMITSPSFSSAETASEMAENYWLALTRDIPFCDYSTSPLIIAATEDLSKFSDFRGPKHNGKVTTKTLFRGVTPGDLIGPYISQFLYLNIPFGSRTITQRYRTTLAKDNFMTDYPLWLLVQNGISTKLSNNYDTLPRYIRNGRDLGEWVHQDFSFQSVLSACLILMSFGKDALAQENPYLNSKTQSGFVTFGSAHILDLVTQAARKALEAAWFQKFIVFRRLRPEEFGGRVHNCITGATKYAINPELFSSKALSRTFSKFGTYLLPMAYPEGCPTHPAYPAGHATIVGAGVTMLKAFFKEDFVIPNPVSTNSDGTSLVSYCSKFLTIGGELNKLASNISLGRDTAGVHWRSDGIEGLKLGEAVAIGILQDYKECFNETFAGFSFKKFDGTTITI